MKVSSRILALFAIAVFGCLFMATTVSAEEWDVADFSNPADTDGIFMELEGDDYYRNLLGDFGDDLKSEYTNTTDTSAALGFDGNTHVVGATVFAVLAGVALMHIQ